MLQVLFITDYNSGETTKFSVGGWGWGRIKLMKHDTGCCV